MKIYRVHYQSRDNNSLGHNFWATKKEADIDLEEHIEIDPSDHYGSVDVIEFPFTKAGILEAVFVAGSHADNG